MLSDRSLCDELITSPEESYRLWCVVVCDLENLKNEEAMTRFGSQRHSNKYIYIYNFRMLISLLYSAADNPEGQFVQGTKYCRMALTFLDPLL